MYLSLSNYTDIVGGFSYATCGFFVGNAEHITFLIAAMVYPLLHLAVIKTMSVNIRWSVIGGLAIGLLILNNYPPFVIVGIIFILLVR